MDTLLKHGDFFRNSCGLPVAIEGHLELLQSAMIRLTVRQGSFTPDPSLGSKLYRLQRSNLAQMNQMASNYVREALSSMPELRINGVSCAYLSDSDQIRVHLILELNSHGYRLTIPIGG